MRNLFFVLFVAGCAQGTDISPEVVAVPDRAANVEVELPPISISLPMGTYPELLGPGTSAANRWSRATGRQVQIGEGGIPLVVMDEVVDSQGKPTRERVTTIWVDGILVTYQIEYRSDSLDQADRILPHAFGHALGGYGHSESGVMKKAPSLGELIDEASLELVCQNLNCLDFRPET